MLGFGPIARGPLGESTATTAPQPPVVSAQQVASAMIRIRKVAGAVLPIPLAPTNVSATDGTLPTSVTISWNASANATSYAVYRSTTLGLQGSSIGISTQTSFNDSSATPGVQYYYAVSAANASGSSAASAQDSGYAGSLAVQAPPTGVTASDGTSGTSVTITWSPASGATSYTVYRSTTPGIQGSSVGSTNATSLVDSTVTPDTQYYFAVVASGPTGTSVLSNQDGGYAGTITLPAFVPPPGTFAEFSLDTPLDANPHWWPTTGLGGQNVPRMMANWSGGVFVPEYGTMGALCFHGGGEHHAAYDSQGILLLDCGTRRWSVTCAPNPIVEQLFPMTFGRQFSTQVFAINASQVTLSGDQRSWFRQGQAAIIQYGVDYVVDGAFGEIDSVAYDGSVTTLTLAAPHSELIAPNPRQNPPNSTFPRGCVVTSALECSWWGTYASASSFTVRGDHTDNLTVGLQIVLYHGVASDMRWLYSDRNPAQRWCNKMLSGSMIITGATYSGGVTTVDVTPSPAPSYQGPGKDVKISCAAVPTDLFFVATTRLGAQYGASPESSYNDKWGMKANGVPASPHTYHAVSWMPTVMGGGSGGTVVMAGASNAAYSFDLMAMDPTDYYRMSWACVMAFDLVENTARRISDDDAFYDYGFSPNDSEAGYKAVQLPRQTERNGCALDTTKQGWWSLDITGGLLNFAGIDGTITKYPVGFSLFGAHGYHFPQNNIIVWYGSPNVYYYRGGTYMYLQDNNTNPPTITPLYPGRNAPYDELDLTWTGELWWDYKQNGMGRIFDCTYCSLAYSTILQSFFTKINDEDMYDHHEVWTLKHPPFDQFYDGTQWVWTKHILTSYDGSLGTSKSDVDHQGTWHMVQECPALRSIVFAPNVDRKAQLLRLPGM